MKLREWSSGKVEKDISYDIELCGVSFLYVSFGWEVVMIDRVLHKDSVGNATVICGIEIVNDDGKIRILGLQIQNALVRGIISPKTPGVLSKMACYEKVIAF